MAHNNTFEVGDRDIYHLMAPGSERRQSLRGFDEDYVDIVDYIVRCTYKIWEQKGIGRIYDHYRHNAIIHTSDGTVYGRDRVIADSIKTMAAFPDVRLYADEVIWTGNDQDGFYTSHRITWVAHNTGYSNYGPPTGRKIVRRGIAECFVTENRVVEEWIARDEMALIRQLGYEPHALAKKMAARDLATGRKVGPAAGYGEVERVVGQERPPVYQPKSPGGFDMEDFIRQSQHEIWNWRLLNKVEDYYSPNYLCRTSPNRELYGLGDFKAYILAMLGAFPDANLSIDKVYWLGNAADGFKVAVRWWLQGTHEGNGVYGEPTGARIRLLGITHYDVKDGQFIKEWTCFDQFAVLKQIYAFQMEKGTLAPPD